MNFLRNRKQEKNRAGRRDSGRRNQVIAYGVLTLAVIWTAALSQSTEGVIDPGPLIGGLLLTTFVMATGLILFAGNGKDRYEE